MEKLDDAFVNTSESLLQGVNTLTSTGQAVLEGNEINSQDDVKVDSTSNSNEVFKINMGAISCVPEERQENELLGLGIDVYDQTKLEEEVMAQVESAFSKKEEEMKQQQAKRDMKNLAEELRSVRQRLGQIEKALSMAPKKDLSNGARRQVEAIKREKENKNKQLRKLEAKRKSLSMILGESSEEFSNNSLNIMGSCELDEETKVQLTEVFSERAHNDLLISTGEMTPFGTMLSSPKKLPLKSNRIKVTNDELTDFEKFLLHNGDKKTNPLATGKKVLDNPKSKKIVGCLDKPSCSTDVQSLPSTSGQLTALNVKRKKKMILLGSKHATGILQRKRSYSSMNLNYANDPEASDIENGDANYDDNDYDNKSGSEYLPEGDSDMEGTKHRNSGGSENDVPWVSVNKKKKSNLNKKDSKGKNPFKRVHDDGNEKIFLRRLREYRIQLQMEKEDKLKLCAEKAGMGEDIDKITDDNEDVVEFDGGFKVPSKIWNKLFRYQQTGVRWLWELHQQNCGGIVGDEMGLGKTIQVIAFFAALQCSNLRSEGDRFQGLGPVVLVCPATVMHQWVKEFHKWWPPVRVAILHVSGSYSGSKDSLVRYINRSKGVLVTSYAGITHYQTVLHSYDWHYVVLDEGHKIRNPDAQVTLACKQFRTPHRIILSGSPIQNNLKELWSLFDFVFPGKLGTLPIFMQQFSVPITHGGYSNASEVQVQTAYKCAVVLRDTIRPYMLRRLKADVKMSLELPNKNEQVLFCKLTDEQRDVYRQYLESPEIAQIADGKFQIFVGLINLRKICNHPDIYTGGPKIFAHTDVDSLKKEDRYGYYKRSGKMIVIEALLKLWHKQSHRVLLFTQSRQMLTILEEFLKGREYTYLKMDGSTSIGSRQPTIHKFNTDTSIFVFLLTTRVGGLGVNLTGANRVIIFDPDWNPSTDLQARERAWRIGQEKQVTIYRLLTSGTIEEKIYHRQIFKQFLTNRVLKDPRQRRFFKSNDLHELFTLGTEDGKGTETSAIFAGTGSEVKMHKLKRQPKKEVQSPKFSFSAKKVEQMKELSKTLSLRMSKGEKDTKEEKGAESKEKIMLIENKKKKLKKKKDKFEGIIFEGEHINNLVSQDTFKPENDEKLDEKQDDYILKKLFKNSSVQTALRHDTIVNSSDPDYLLVEGEAERVAKEAVQALKKSRKQCLGASAGVPTWTGNFGTSGAPPAFKKRFGTKVNTKLLDPGKLAESAQTNSTKAIKMKFGKKVLVTETEEKDLTRNPILSSSELLAKMRQRNGLVPKRKSNDSEHESSDDASTPLPGKATEYDDMLCDIRNFVAFQSCVNGQATTGEVLEAFKEKIPIHGAPVFKALLGKICNFYRSASGDGVWKLKQQFR